MFLQISGVKDCKGRWGVLQSEPGQDRECLKLVVLGVEVRTKYWTLSVRMTLESEEQIV